MCAVYQTLDFDTDFFLELIFRKIDEEESAETNPSVRQFLNFCQNQLASAEEGKLEDFCNDISSKIRTLIENGKFSMEIIEAWIILVNLLTNLTQAIGDTCYAILTKISKPEVIGFRDKLTENGQIWEILAALEVESLEDARTLGEVLLSIVKNDVIYGKKALECLNKVIEIWEDELSLTILRKQIEALVQ